MKPGNSKGNESQQGAENCQPNLSKLKQYGIKNYKAEQICLAY